MRGEIDKLDTKIVFESPLDEAFSSCQYVNRLTVVRTLECKISRESLVGCRRIKLENDLPSL